MATESQVAKQAEKNEKLRQQIAELSAARETAEREATNDVRLQQLQAEEQQLQVELDYARRLEEARKSAEKRTTETPEGVVAPAAVGTNVQTPVDRTGETATTQADGKGK